MICQVLIAVFTFSIFPYTYSQSVEDSSKIDFVKGPLLEFFKKSDNVFIFPTNIEDTTIKHSLKRWMTDFSNHCPGSTVLSDSAALASNLNKKNIVTTGNQSINLWINENKEYLPFGINENAIITNKEYPGKNLMLTICMPSPFNPGRGWYLFIAQSIEAYDKVNTENQAFFYSDWSLLDSSGVISSGNFIKKEGTWSYPELNDIDLSKDAKWIWFPGDFEVWLNHKTSLMRRERNQIYPPLWRLDSPYSSVIFSKRVTVTRPDTISVYADGDFSILLNGERLYDYDPEHLIIPPGTYYFDVNVVNRSTFPALLIKGKSLITDTTWRVGFGLRYENHVPGIWDFSDPQLPPGKFALKEKNITPAKTEESDTSIFVDFGKETFGRLILEDVKGRGKIFIVYGESKEEASAGKEAETWEYKKINHLQPKNDTMEIPMAFRYVSLHPDTGISIGNITHLYEYLPVKKKGQFECSDPVINKIFEVSSRTLELNTRELLFDGIKRDRWCWSGDVLIGLLLDYYHYFDEDVVKRSLIALRGHDPVIHHINIIPNYSFYWFISMYNHFLFSGDTAFAEQMYDKMQTTMDYCFSMINEDGLVAGDRDKDWIFIDWAEIPMYGELCIDQVLFWKSLEVMAAFAKLTGHQDDYEIYNGQAGNLKEKTMEYFWKHDLGGFIHHTKHRVEDDNIYTESYDSSFVTRYANIYGILFDLLSEKQKELATLQILMSDSIQEVKVPFHRIFEMSGLCEMGKHEIALKRMKNYWKGMLEMGATTFWEDYDSTLTGVHHYKWSGRKFGKSLCHIWGASPIYLLGRYIAGVKPMEPGYKSYLIQPNLGGLDWFDASVPVKGGMVHVSMNEKEIKLKSDIGGGVCRFVSEKKPKTKTGQISETGEGMYEISIMPDKEYKIRYY